MAAPTITARITPTGIYLEDGYQSVVAFAVNPSVNLWEITVKPSGIDGGDPIDTNTMHNVTYRTRRARKLKTRTEMTLTVAYDPAVVTDLIALVNVEGAITQHWPDSGTEAFFGFLQKIEFDALEEGKMPTATVTIIPTNWDPVNHVEAAAVVTPALGT